jgi:hypothetical protein
MPDLAREHERSLKRLARLEELGAQQTAIPLEEPAFQRPLAVPPGERPLRRLRVICDLLVEKVAAARESRLPFGDREGELAHPILRCGDDSVSRSLRHEHKPRVRRHTSAVGFPDDLAVLSLDPKERVEVVRLERDGDPSVGVGDELEDPRRASTRDRHIVVHEPSRDDLADRDRALEPQVLPELASWFQDRRGEYDQG